MDTEKREAMDYGEKMQLEEMRQRKKIQKKIVVRGVDKRRGEKSS